MTNSCEVFELIHCQIGGGDEEQATELFFDDVRARDLRAVCFGRSRRLCGLRLNLESDAQSG